MNVALYAPGGKRWCMTERGRGELQRDAASLRIGPSAMHWDGTSLTVDIDEVTSPWPSRVRGVVRLRPECLADTVLTLDAKGEHRWRPIAPRARVEVEMHRPGVRWQGGGYFDCNWGDSPLEAAFTRWDWSRAHLAGGDSAVLYDVTDLRGETSAWALRFDRDGATAAFESPPRVMLPPTGWRLQRGTRSEPGDGRYTDAVVPARVVATLEDAPFYARSTIETQLLGERVIAVHESLSLERFGTPIVQAMLPFRMPRRRGRDPLAPLPRSTRQGT